MKHGSYSIQITKPEYFVLCERVQQAEYSGLIMRIVSDEQDSDEETGAEQEPENQDLPFTLEYGITSLVDKKTVLQLGEKVCSCDKNCTVLHFKSQRRGRRNESVPSRRVYVVKYGRLK